MPSHFDLQHGEPVLLVEKRDPLDQAGEAYVRTRCGIGTQVGYVYRGKKTSKFIRREALEQVRAELANYKKFRRLTEQWIGLALNLAQAKEKLAA